MPTTKVIEKISPTEVKLHIFGKYGGVCILFQDGTNCPFISIPDRFAQSPDSLREIAEALKEVADQLDNGTFWPTAKPSIDNLEYGARLRNARGDYLEYIGNGDGPGMIVCRRIDKDTDDSTSDYDEYFYKPLELDDRALPTNLNAIEDFVIDTLGAVSFKEAV